MRDAALYLSDSQRITNFDATRQKFRCLQRGIRFGKKRGKQIPWEAQCAEWPHRTTSAVIQEFRLTWRCTLQYKVDTEEVAMKDSTSRSRLAIFAVSEWLLVLPAAVLLAAAALRQLQPRQYEPARTSWLIFEWTTAHISRAGAALLFLGLPGIVVIMGCTALLRIWGENETLRQDATSALASFRRHAALGLMAMATLLACAIVSFAVLHVIAD
jgi:hypothetical protein